jgi:hypothetical protein
VYIVKLNPDLLEVNARVASRTQAAAFKRPVISSSGTLHNGYNEATAQIAPGASGTVTVSFEIVVVSVPSTPFELYRKRLQLVLGRGTELHIAKAAGIGPMPPPAPASQMAGYVDQLFSQVVFSGAAVTDQSRAFSCASPECTMMLWAMRSLEVTKVSFSGTLTASSASPETADVAAYIPITAVEFSDGLTIPFAGYSGNVLVDYSGVKQLDVPSHFWSELAGADAPPA